MNKYLKFLLLSVSVITFSTYSNSVYALSSDIDFVSASKNNSIQNAIEIQNLLNLESVDDANLLSEGEKNQEENNSQVRNVIPNEKDKYIKYIQQKNSGISMETAEKIYDSARKYSDMYGLDINIIMAMIESESTFNPNCVGKNVHGLMQIHENTAPYLGLSMSNIYDIDSNIGAGTGYIAKFLKKYNNPSIALTCYSHGESSYINGTYSTWYSDLVISRANQIKLAIVNL